MPGTHVSICICTYRRPEMLRRLLQELERQEVPDTMTFSLVVADNDASESMRPVVAGFAAGSKLKVTYCCEPEKNFARARNRAVAQASGDYIAFIDDDEFPVPSWLRLLLETCEAQRAAGVLGPVRPHFESAPPGWLLKGRFCERREHPTGTVMPWSECRTGNVLFRRSILETGREPFDPAFGTGGEDVDFFQRMQQRGAIFIWCNEAIAFETVPASRWTRRYLLRRALLRGRNSLKLQGQRGRLLLMSLVAVPAYSLIMPATLLFGQHVFMHYCIRLCDHLGRLLAMVRLNPVRER